MGRVTTIIAALLCCAASATAVRGQESLPAPSPYPLEIDFSDDPVLLLGRRHAEAGMLGDAVAAAVARHPATAESLAVAQEAEALVESAQAQRRPTVDLSMTYYRVIAREFSNDPENIIERSRPAERTDAVLQVQQTLFDFGAGAARVRAAGARLRAAAADVEATADRVALNAVAAWYDVFGYRALVALTEAFIASQRELREAVEERIRRGASAEGDLARIDSDVALAMTRLARFQRQLDNAEVRFAELTGYPPPAGLERAPVPLAVFESRDYAALIAARNAAEVRSAEAVADAARLEAKAASAERLPQLSGGVDAGRYGVFENDRDYDIRGRLALRQRLFGGVDARYEQIAARARAAAARADRVREEAARDAAIAWSDVQALERQLEALEAAYVASRRSRDVIVERFRAARGTLFDVGAAEGAYFTSATAYIEGLTELDAARYVLLSRTGRLLELLGIEADRLGASDE